MIFLDYSSSPTTTLSEHPIESIMDKIRKEARQVLRQTPWNRPTVLQSASARLTLAELWADVSSHDNSTCLDVRLFMQKLYRRMLIG